MVRWEVFHEGFERNEKMELEDGRECEEVEILRRCENELCEKEEIHER